MEQLQRDTPPSGLPAVLGWRVVTKQALIALGLALGAVLTWSLGVSYVVASWGAARRLGETFFGSGLWASATIACLVFCWLSFESGLAAWGFAKRAFNLAKYLRAVRRDWK
jgi:hypothetical protein